MASVSALPSALSTNVEFHPTEVPKPVPMNSAQQELTIRCGFELVYDAAAWTPAILTVEPRLDPWQRQGNQRLTLFPNTPVETFEDSHGNFVRRFTLPPGRTTVRNDTFIAVPPTTDEH